MPMEMKTRLKINRFVTHVSDLYSRYIDNYTDKQRGQHAQREKLKIKLRELALREHLVKISEEEYESVKLSEEEKELLGKLDEGLPEHFNDDIQSKYDAVIEHVNPEDILEYLDERSPKSYTRRLSDARSEETVKGALTDAELADIDAVLSKASKTITRLSEGPSSVNLSTRQGRFYQRARYDLTEESSHFDTESKKLGISTGGRGVKAWMKEQTREHNLTRFKEAVEGLAIKYSKELPSWLN